MQRPWHPQLPVWPGNSFDAGFPGPMLGVIGNVVNGILDALNLLGVLV